MKNRLFIPASLLLAAGLLLPAGCKESENVHAVLATKLRKAKAVEIDWAAEKEKCKDLTSLERGKALKSLYGKKVSVEITVADVLKGTRPVHHLSSFDEAAGGGFPYFEKSFVRVEGAAGPEEYTALLPKNQSAVKPGEKIRVEGLIDSVNLADKWQIGLYPAKVVTE